MHLSLRIPILATLLSAAVAPVWAQDGGTTGAAPTGADVERMVRERDEEERRAVLARDVEALADLWSADFVVNSPMNEVVVKEQVLELVRNGTIHYSEFERDIDDVRVHDDVVVLMGRERILPIENAPNAGKTVERRFTNVWKLEDGVWRAIARHANIVSVEPSS